MIFRFILSVIIAVVLSISAAASDRYFIVLGCDDSKLRDFDGRYFGKETNRLFFIGDNSALQWLAKHRISYDAAKYDGEQSNLYLCYLDRGLIDIDQADILFRGENYVVSISSPDKNIPCRLLRHMPFPKAISAPQSDVILTYDPRIDEMIGLVDQSAILDMLGRLSGAIPIEMDGIQDTIFTRCSGTADNLLAARYLRQILQEYGYQTAYHSLYGGTIRNIASYDQNLAWMVTEGPEAFRTTDGGAEWLLMSNIQNDSLWGIANWGSNQVWITGDHGRIRFSDDGGRSFAAQNSGVNIFLFGANFISATEGWIAGDNGKVLHTSNGGQNWNTQQTPTGLRLYDIRFVDSSNGWACGADGIIVHTDNGGESWNSQSSNTEERLYSVDFVNSLNGWAVGWSGTVCHTADGGANWQIVDIGAQNDLFHVEFSDPSFGCVVGYNGEIFVTSNGGANWEPRSSGTQADLYGVSFVDSLVGFAGGNGITMKTSDGGLTWVNQTPNVASAWVNVIATKTGTTTPDEQVMICAHMDNTSEQEQTLAPGADDNGSGSIAVMETARIFAQYNFEKTIKFSLWTGEEQRMLGSLAYAAEAFERGDNIIGVFNFDMVSWDGNGDGSVEFHTGTENPSINLGDAMLEVVNDYNLDLEPDIITWGATGLSDHSSFWQYGYPAMLAIEDYSSDFNFYYHTTQDNLEHINNEFFAEYARAAVGIIATMAIPDTSNTSISRNDMIPKGFVLNANYPNPFNAATTISFSVPYKTEIDLAVYDILGRKVATLYSGIANAGENRVTWNADRQSSGVYFYGLTADGHASSARMILLK